MISKNITTQLIQSDSVSTSQTSNLTSVALHCWREDREIHGNSKHGFDFKNVLNLFFSGVGKGARNFVAAIGIEAFPRGV
jgi:hypothetical protein